MGIKVNLKNVRIGWVNVFEKAKDSVDKNGNPVKGKYGFTVYLDPEDPQISKLDDAAMEVLTEGLKSEAAADKWMKRNFGFGQHSDKCAVRDLAERDKPIEGLEEGLYFKATSHRHLTNVQTSLGEKQASQNQKAVKGLTAEGDDVEGSEIYGGCYANVSVEMYWHKDFKNLCICALGVRFKDDGEAFGGSGESAEDEDLEDEDDAPRGRKKAPAKPTRRSRDEDDEEEETTRRSRRSRDEDDEDDRPRRRNRR